MLQTRHKYRLRPNALDHTHQIPYRIVDTPTEHHYLGEEITKPIGKTPNLRLIPPVQHRLDRGRELTLQDSSTSKATIEAFDRPPALKNPEPGT